MSADVIDIFLYFKKISPLIHTIQRVRTYMARQTNRLYALRMIVKLAYRTQLHEAEISVPISFQGSKPIVE